MFDLGLGLKFDLGLGMECGLGIWWLMVRNGLVL